MVNFFPKFYLCRWDSTWGFSPAGGSAANRIWKRKFSREASGRRRSWVSGLVLGWLGRLLGFRHHPVLRRWPCWDRASTVFLFVIVIRRILNIFCTWRLCRSWRKRGGSRSVWRNSFLSSNLIINKYKVITISRIQNYVYTIQHPSYPQFKDKL